MNERLVAHVSRWKTLLLVLAGIGFVLLGIWLVRDPGMFAESGRRARDPLIIRGVGWLAILFFGAVGIVGVRQLFRTGPVMRVDEAGILWRRWSDRTIPWDAIVRAEAHDMMGQQFMCLWLDEPERYRPTSLLGRTARINKGMGFGDIALSLQGTDQRFDRLVAVIDAHLRNRDQRVGTGSAPE